MKAGWWFALFAVMLVSMIVLAKIGDSLWLAALVMMIVAHRKLKEM